ncbi:cytochrome b/b6 domain-containing protein [Acetobacteraceae bacterium H6797]|nr:cytochrome b/b6 domain-containing protein [Acetobacteraceae bacterium H6797]
MPDETPGWRPAQRRLHWWVAALVALGFAIGLTMMRADSLGVLVTFLLYQIHKSIGLVVLLLVLWRLWLRHRHGRPPEVELPHWERRAAAIGQGLLYALLLVVPVLGYLTASAAPIGIETLFLFVIPLPPLVAPDQALYEQLEPIHRAAAWALVLLALGHAGMAVARGRVGRMRGR